MSLPVRGAWIEISSWRVMWNMSTMSLPVRGAWIEISGKFGLGAGQHRRSPCGERGLKSSSPVTLGIAFCRSPCGERGLKLSTNNRDDCKSRRSPCGERGLKYHVVRRTMAAVCRSPCGERGLKSFCASCPAQGVRSLPVRGAWIEMLTRMVPSRVKRGRSPCGERGLKWVKHRSCLLSAVSLPVRGAWIEMRSPRSRRTATNVAPRAGSVD